MDFALDRIDRLVGSGLTATVATQVAICELGLADAAVSGEVGCVLAAQVAAAVMDDASFAAVRRHCVAPEWEAAWARFAQHSLDPARRRFLALEQLSRRRRLRLVS